MLQITDSISDLGGMNWDLLATLSLSWLIVYLIIWKGLHSSGKVQLVRNWSDVRADVHLKNRVSLLVKRAISQIYRDKLGLSIIQDRTTSVCASV